MWDRHDVIDHAVGGLALHYAEEDCDEAVAALDGKSEAVIREPEAQHRKARRSRSFMGISTESTEIHGRSAVVVILAVTMMPVLTGLKVTAASAWSGLSWSAWQVKATV